MTTASVLVTETARVDAALIGLFGSPRCGCPERHAVSGHCEASRADVPARHDDSVIPLCRECAACWPR